MRLFTILLALTFVCSSSCRNKESVTKQQARCFHSKSTANEYTPDAQQILLREIRKDSINHPHFFLPGFDSAAVNEILNAIHAVKELNTPESKLVFDHYKIHVSSGTSMRTLLVLVDPNAQPVVNLVGSYPTTDPVFDSILALYNYDHTQTFSTYPDFAWVVLHFKEDFNFFALQAALANLTYIQDVAPDFIIGDGNELKVKRKGNSFVLNFSHGWGDCPAGCINRHHWVFEVDAHCNARFVKEYGDALTH